MADHSIQRETLEIGAPVAACVAVACDVERYPEWASDLKEATVLSRTEDDNPCLVSFRVAAFGRSTTYTLRYDFTQLPGQIAWVLEEGELTTKLDGAYTFTEVVGDPSRTTVRYDLEVELIIPLPNIVKHRAEMKIIHTALRDLKARVEELHEAADV